MPQLDNGKLDGMGNGRKQPDACSAKGCVLRAARNKSNEGRETKKLTLSDAGDGEVLVAVGLAQSKQDVDLGPVGEHFLDDLDLGAVLELQLADLALIVEGGQGRICVILGVAVGASTGATPSPSREAAAATAA